MPRVSDIGYLRRRDKGDGWAELLDGFGNTIATVKTDVIEAHCRDGQVGRFRVVVKPLD